MKTERFRQIDKIFRDVIKREPHERAQFLDLACAHDPTLRKEVEELIGSYQEAGGFLEVPVFIADDSQQSASGVPGANIPGEASNPLAVLPGTQLGPYTIERFLGAGGMGRVFSAVDTRLSRQVAIKILLTGGQRAGASTERFFQEARAASALNHPNIVT